MRRLLLETLRERALPDGGFAGRPAGDYRPDATAWACLALRQDAGSADLVRAALARLVADQLDDGRVPVRPEHPEAIWPTCLAVLAWQGSSLHSEQRERAVEFLLRHGGEHWPMDPDAPSGHDTSLRGWPWCLNTHSWVEPTSLCVLALRAVGWERHPRVREAVRMLLDRMLPRGGWNYGNVSVFGRQLEPFPQSTGLALSALAGLVRRERVAPSIEYLATRLERVRTPLTLGWGLLGLGAWGERPERASLWLAETSAREPIAGAHDTAHLAILAVAHTAGGGLLSDLQRRGLDAA